MQTQDAPAELIFKLWPWIEANKNRLIGALVAVIAAAGIFYFYSSQKEQHEIEAGQALTAVLMNPGNADSTKAVDSLTQMASKYSGTAAAKRAQLQTAGNLFAAGRYAEAQAEFQKFLDPNPGGQIAATAQLGIAASLEAQDKTDLAVAAYQKVITSYSTSTCVEQAEFALGRIAEQQNKLTDAVNHYQNAARFGMSTSLAQEAAMRAAEIREKIPAAAPATGAAIKPAAAVTPAPTPAPAPATAKPAGKP